MPRWFGGQEEVPCLRDLARALRLGRRLAPQLPAPRAGDGEPRVVGPLGLVNKAGIWYLVASSAGGIHDRPAIRVFRVARIARPGVLPEPLQRPAGFELAVFWREWSAEFEASRLPVTLRASPRALATFGVIFGRAAGPALAAALPPDGDGWRVATLSLEHERAAAHRLAGFGDQVEVLAPPSVRARLVATARQLPRRYHAADMNETPRPSVRTGMQTWEAITSRRNVRSFADRPIPAADLDRILEAGRRSPSSQNWQPWDFIVVTDRAQLRELAKVWRGAGHVARSAATIVVVGPAADNAFRRAQLDLGQATMAMLLAAADLGIGSCHAGVADLPLARELLGFPDDRDWALLISLGYPADRPLAPIKNPDRRPFDDVVHRGHWDAPTR